MLSRLVGSLLPGVGELAGVGLRALSAPCVREYTQQLAITNKANKAGPGGRSSVSGLTATVFGANGFVGSYVVNELARRGAQVITPYRSTENDMQHVKQMGDLGQIVMLSDFDIRDEDHVKYSISRSNVVINLIGQRMETMNFKFDDVHVKWPETLAKIVAGSPHVERFIHFSESGATLNHASRRLSSKAKGDKIVREILPDATLVKPAPIVGIEDHFYNYLIYQLSFGLVAPIVDAGEARMQPTWVRDVAEATYQLLKFEESKGQDYYLVGPETLTVRDVYDLMIKTLRLQTDDTIHVPKPIAKALMAPLDIARRNLPYLPMDNFFNSLDYVEESSRDNLAPLGSLGYAALGIKPNKVTDGLPLEPVRHFRKGGYRWGDMASVAKDVPESIKKYYNIK